MSIPGNSGKKYQPAVILLSLSLLTLLIHFFTNAVTGFGIFRDEFYYLACSRRLTAGYVDQPPLSIFLLALSRMVFGDSLFAIRIFPALSGAFSVFLTGLIVQRLGGGKFAVVLASICYIAAPVFLAMNNIYSMNAFDILLWTAAFYILILLFEENASPQKKTTGYWIWLGIILGLGLLNKISILWFGTGLFLALLTRQYRHFLKTPGPYTAALIAFLLFIPFVIWNIEHGLAHLEFMENASGIKYRSVTPLDLLSGQILLMLPFSLPVWIAGVYYFFSDKKGKTFRAIGIIYLATIAILVVNWHSKPEYAAPAYPVLFAGGSILIEKFLSKKHLRRLSYAFSVIIAVGGILLSPFCLPFLPVKTFVGYSRMTGIQPGGNEGKKLSSLPQIYADMFGWENMARTVSEVYLALPEGERRSAFVFAQNYGEASALEYYGKKYPLPKVVCPHNSFWLWQWEELKNRPNLSNYRTVIIIGGRKEDHMRVLEKVEQKGFIKSEFAMPYENNLPVYVGNSFRLPLKTIWESEKRFI
ncbi:MAG: glycosyltransferase family 39 protein [Ignavibacteria bacterium]|jgi:hypothetical protein|nr:glycosyltransferase family 39 protein [Ignavibacteria bacterium]MCU7502099.1 glycosyltransferase family 39 protein [Ignavibacteria bacterium]MCU7515501.1 glycosyltransferase family 39 protein [Ignavibacteria bacterium]